jgi:toxoflavin biosynthesis protein ToxD
MSSGADGIDWVEIPAGQLVRGTPVVELEEVLSRHADLDLQLAYFGKECPPSTIEVAPIWYPPH